MVESSKSIFVLGIPVVVPKEELEKQTTPVRIAVFTDLWENGYFVTSGNKFGGDFLVYLGK